MQRRWLFLAAASLSASLGTAVAMAAQPDLDALIAPQLACVT